jgi:transcriptional regulator with XRE-family HTH domain
MPPRSARHAAFGAAIRDIRKERGFSQEDLALEAGLDRSYFGGVERGERNVSLANVFRIADALSVRPSEIHVRAESVKRRR